MKCRVEMPASSVPGICTSSWCFKWSSCPCHGQRSSPARCQGHTEDPGISVARLRCQHQHGAPASQKVFEEKPPLGPNKVRHLWDIHIEAADCADCRFSTPAIHGHGIPRTGQAPAFLGSYDAYIWAGMGFRDDSRISGYPWLAEGLDPAQRLDFLRRLSINLPTWAYIYIPYDPQIAPYPQILHRGRELILVEPGLDEPESRSKVSVSGESVHSRAISAAPESFGSRW